MESTESDRGDMLEAPAASNPGAADTSAVPTSSPQPSTSVSQPPPLCVVRPYGYAETDCGYCKGSRSNLLVNRDATNCSRSYSLLADTMTPSLYEGFMYRGWRRSGVHLYKPCNFDSCCPTITIRLCVSQFHPTKAQRKVMNKMTKIDDDRNTTSSVQNKRTLSVHSSSDAVVRSSGILDDLEDITKQAVAEYVEEYEQQKASSLSSSPSKWKTSYRLLQQSKHDSRQDQIHASCIVCAQLSGTYKIPRDGFVKNVVDKMIHNLKAKAKQTKNDDGIDAETGADDSATAIYLVSKNGKVALMSIKGDEVSGQIRVVLQIDSEKSGEDDDVNMKEVGNDDLLEVTDKNNNVPTKRNNNTDTDTHDDKLNKWYRDRCKVSSMSSSIRSDESQGVRVDSSDQFSSQKKPRLGLDPSSSSADTDDNAIGTTLINPELTITTIAGHKSALMPEVHRLYTWYQNAVHGDADPFTSPSTAPASPMDTDDNNADADLELDEAESESDLVDPADLDWGNAPQYFKDAIDDMLNRYLGTIDDPKRQQKVLKSYYSYYQFLVEAPFPFTKPQQTQPINASKKERGLYHQQYRLGSVLIAVGVVDILPSGLSSVYLYYDPLFSHKFAPLGKYAILKEIEYTRDTLKLPFYYLGYFIESCQKMRYKAEYSPSELLCPKYYQWVDAPTAILKLQKTPRQVCALVGDDEKEKGDDGDDEGNSTTATNFNGNGNDERKVVDEISLHRIQMDIGAGMNVTLDMLQPSGVDIVKPILQDFLTESGPELAQQCLVKLS